MYPAMSQGSAISFTGASTGSWWTRSKNALWASPLRLAGERGGQVEAEAVDVHLGHPVAQRVQNEPQSGGVADVEAVAGAGGVVVASPVARRPGGSTPGCRCP